MRANIAKEHRIFDFICIYSIINVIFFFRLEMKIKYNFKHKTIFRKIHRY